MHVLLAFDKFKGSLAADQVATAVRDGILSTRLDIHCEVQSVADGGGGTLDILAKQFKESTIIYVDKILDPRSRPRTARYLRLHDTAFIEMAEASGIELILDMPLDALAAHNYGTGQLMDHAIRRGCTEIYLMIGGSASTDLGLGALSAMGVLFFDAKEELITDLCGRSLDQIHRIDATSVLHKTQDINIKILCDVNNPLLGLHGSARTYGPQKGANAQEIKLLERGLDDASTIIESTFHVKIKDYPGGGAAGGIAAGMMGILGADLISGSETIMRWLDMEQKVMTADVIVTGEGSFDTQSLQGKIVSRIIALAEKHGKPLYVICGQSAFAQPPQGVKAIFSVIERSESLQDALDHAPSKLERIGSRLAQSRLGT